MAIFIAQINILIVLLCILVDSAINQQSRSSFARKILSSIRTCDARLCATKSTVPISRPYQ
uniref:Secreted protein n=1 Tax=Romanomermis culicivorax TaxID=13658 RepID=A0A915L622_ROMCU